MGGPRVAFLHLAFEDYSASIANALHELVDLTVVHPEALSDRMRVRLRPEIRTVTFHKPRFRDPRNLSSTPKLLRLLGSFDLLHVQQAGDPWVDLGLATLRDVKTVVTVHDVVAHSGDGDRIPGSYIARGVFHRRVNGFIVHTELMATELADKVGSDRPIGLIPHPALRQLWMRERDPIEWPEHRHDVLFFGRIWPYKGLDILVEAMRAVVERVPDARLVIAGRGAQLDSILPDPIPGWIDVHNRFIDHDEIPGFFERSAVIALPYRDATQSGVGVMAIDFKRPAVASAVGGLSNMFSNDRGGLLVPRQDPGALAAALVRVLTDDNLYRQLQNDLEQRYLDLSPAVIATRTASFYDDLMSR